MATTAQAAQAPLTLKRSGFWETYYAVASDGNHLCGMQVTGNNASLKYIPGRTMFIQIFKTGWRIPPGTSIPGYVTFDRDPPTHVTGEGGTPSSGNSYVEFQIKSAAEAEFSESLATPT